MNGQDTDLVGGNNAIARMRNELSDHPSWGEIRQVVDDQMGPLEAGQVMKMAGLDEVQAVIDRATSGWDVAKQLACQFIAEKCPMMGPRYAVAFFDEHSRYEEDLADLEMSTREKTASVRNLCETLGFTPKPRLNDLMEVLDEQE